MPGSWTCRNCNMGGCWQSKSVCFRCLAPTDEWASAFSPQARQGDATLGQGTSGAENWQSHGQERLCTKPSASTCDTSSTLKGDGQAVLKALRGLGISEALLEQVQASLVLKWTGAGNAREKALAETTAQLHSFCVRVGRQEKAVDNAQECLNRASEKLLLMRHKGDQLHAQFREMQSRLSPSSSKEPSVIGDGTPAGEEEVDTEHMEEEAQTPPPPASGQAVEVSSDWPPPTLHCGHICGEFGLHQARSCHACLWFPVGRCGRVSAIRGGRSKSDDGCSLQNGCRGAARCCPCPS